MPHLTNAPAEVCPFRVIDLASTQAEVLIPVKLTQRTSSSALGSTRCTVRGRSASARLTAQQGPGRSPNPSEWFALTQHHARARRLPYE